MDLEARLQSHKNIQYLALRQHPLKPYTHENLSWQQLAEIVCSNVSKCIFLNFLAHIRPNSYITLRAAKCVYNCIIHPILTYADTVWGELSVGCSKNLQKLQNRAARVVIKRDTLEETFQILNWPNLESQKNS